MARSQTAQNGRPSNEESWLNAFAGLMLRLSLHAASVQATNYHVQSLPRLRRLRSRDSQDRLYKLQQY
jgi:hypothetical protein